MAGELDDSRVLDGALIAAAQAVEHDEITRYGALIAWAKELARDDCASVLQKNLEEENSRRSQVVSDRRIRRERLGGCGLSANCH